MTYVLILLFATTNGFTSAAPVAVEFTNKERCEAAGERWVVEARKSYRLFPQYICLAR
jgi:hypothetical protein